MKDSTALSRVPTRRPVCTRTRMDWVGVADCAAVSGCAEFGGPAVFAARAAPAGCAAIAAIAQAVATTGASDIAVFGGIGLDCLIEGCAIEPCHADGTFRNI